MIENTAALDAELNKLQRMDLSLLTPEERQKVADRQAKLANFKMWMEKERKATSDQSATSRPLPPLRHKPPGQPIGVNDLALLDYFAGQTLIGLLARAPAPGVAMAQGTFQLAASTAYALAEAMLAEHERRQGQTAEPAPVSGRSVSPQSMRRAHPDTKRVDVATPPKG
jgi:hypothetical protein